RCPASSKIASSSLLSASRKTKMVILFSGSGPPAPNTPHYGLRPPWDPALLASLRAATRALFAGPCVRFGRGALRGSYLELKWNVVVLGAGGRVVAGIVGVRCTAATTSIASSASATAVASSAASAVVAPTTATAATASAASAVV